MMLTCDICGKKIFTAYPQNWPYRMMQKVFCSEDCRIVHKARDLHKVEYVTLDTRNLQNAANHYVPVVDMTGHREEAERKEDMKGKILTDEQKARAVEIALDGGDPIAYLRECGCANPWGNWGYIKMKLQKADPEKHKRVLEAEKKRKSPAMVEISEKLPAEAQKRQDVVSAIATAVDVLAGKTDKKPVPPPKNGGEWEKADRVIGKVEKVTRNKDGIKVKVKTELTKQQMEQLFETENRGKAKDLEYKIIGIETKQGKFQYDAASDQLRWMPKGSPVVVMMPAEDWEKLAEDLPGIMKTIGAADREADEE